MNFFGHAVIATEFSVEPDFVLGSMLPDLRAMAGIRADFHDGALVSLGMKLHHETDDLYHNHSLVKERMQLEAVALERIGLHHRQAQAVAHMGLELVTDGILAGRELAEAAFRTAIARAVTATGPVERALLTEVEKEQWQRVGQRLTSGDFPGRYQEPEFVATRMEIVLRRRARLTLALDLLPGLTDWCAGLAERAANEVEPVYQDVVAGIAVSQAES